VVQRGNADRDLVSKCSRHPNGARLVNGIAQGRTEISLCRLHGETMIWVVERNRQDDGLVKVRPLLERYGNFSVFLGQQESEYYKCLRQSETTGHSLGSEIWIEKLEKLTGRQHKPQRRRPKPKSWVVGLTCYLTLRYYVKIMIFRQSIA